MTYWSNFGMEMSVLNELRNYRNSKDKEGHDLIKRNFFDNIIKLMEDDQLTVVTLTDELAKLSSEQRSQLFYRRRARGVSHHCGAAEWVSKLYQQQNVPISKSLLSTMVAEGITPQNQSKLKKQVYNKWEQACFLPRNITSLEHELKGHLKLNKRDYKKLSLAEAVTDHLNANGFDKLEAMLITIDSIAPQYLSELIHNLYRHVNDKNMLIDELLIILDRNPDLSLKVSASNTLIAAAIVVKSPPIFFKLSSSMQHAVLVQLESSGMPQIAEQLFQQSSADPFFQHTDSEKFLHLLANGDYLKDASQKGHDAHDVYKTFRQNIVNKVYPRARGLLSQDINNSAIKAINEYLQKDPNAYKTKFFKELKKEMISSGLTLELLEKHLQASNRKKLFAKWSGQTHSRASGLICTLYKQLSLGTALDEKQIKTMSDDGRLPTIQETLIEVRQTALIKQQIDTILHYPQQARSSLAAREIAGEIDYYRSFYQLSQHALANEQFAREAIYQNYLIKKGLELAKSQKIPVFDPQAHVLIRIELTQDDLNIIVSKMIGKDINDASKEQLALLLGVGSISLATICNLDITAESELRETFKTQMLGTMPSLNLKQAVDTLLTSQERSSIIALQEEMGMHVSLSLRALEKTISKAGITYTSLASDEYQALMIEINTLVLKCFRKELEEAWTTSNQLNYEKLNQGLDKARKDLAPEARKILITNIMKKIPSAQQDAFINELLPALDDHVFTSTTATGCDYLRTDASNHTVVRITATDFTAHDKNLGSNKQALRLLARNHYDADSDNAVTPYKIKTQEARVPSIASRKLARNAAEIIQDVTAKLKYSYNMLSAKQPAYQEPMIYNLLTSLHTKAYDNTLFERKNKQRKSAEQILLGAHGFNRQQLKRGQPYQLIYIQNIPVNQHSRCLDNNSIDSVTAEATLMTDMALMSTLNHYQTLFPPALGKSIAATYQKAHAHYMTFLSGEANGIHFFKDSVSGKQAIKNFEKKKATWSNALNQLTPETELQSLVVQALFKIMTNNLYRNKQFGMLVQSLSVFVEPLSQGGCKSANERYQAVAGRVELLKSISNGDEPSLKKKAVVTILNEFVLGKASIEQVQEAVDVAYNHHNLQGSAAVFSEEDQGASSKVVATANKSNPGKVTELTNTNVAESGYLTRLHQKYSSGMQAHKADLTNWFQKHFMADSALSAKKSSYTI